MPWWQGPTNNGLYWHNHY
jgi:hypothetical protein